MQIYHNSQNPEYRRPFGAAAVSSEVTLSLSAPEAAEAVLRVWQDERGETRYPMARRDGRFVCTIRVPDTGCLLWYYFIITRKDGDILYYGAQPDGLGGEGQVSESEPPSFQITVYRPAPVPDWYKDALVYQIFPDRFRRGGDWQRRAAEAVRPDTRSGPRRVIQEDWNDTPFYTRDGNGDITRWPFFGGTLSGIREKLGYLRSLGVTALYLNPIFQAASNHRYDTGDYTRVDPMLGDEAEFAALCREAEAAGIRVILDGVFSHTGADSVYFDRFGNYGGHGAWTDEDSPYRSWYRFTPEKAPGYACWWGVADLPEVEELEPSYRDFICGKDGIVRRWMRAGAAGWRLDVADELPDAFIRGIREAVKAEKPDGVLIGEVWEDASRKVSYHEHRRYLEGEELDAVMNYPLREMLLDYVLGKNGPSELSRRILSLMENYPPENFYGGLNLIGGHDRARILTLLGEAPEDLPPDEREHFRLTPEARALAVRRLKLLSVLQYACPGVPCLYYGDEAGLEGYTDPYNRGTYPWGREDRDLLTHYRVLGQLYQAHPVLKNGDFRPEALEKGVWSFLRDNGEERVLALANPDPENTVPAELTLPGTGWALELLTGRESALTDGVLSVQLPPCTAALYLLRREPPRRIKLDRTAGVLCHISSVPGSGTLGADARAFADYIADAGMGLWQILPLNPTGLGDSPYLSSAVFAGNPALIDRREPPDTAGYAAFLRDNGYWLEDYALFAALSRHFRGLPWQEWPADARDRTDLSGYRALLDKEIDALRFEQYWFFSQWRALRAYCAERGISLIGDLPIYVAADGADTWAHREVFLLDGHGRRRARAGVPPDYFTPEGQDWGNPLYDWAALRRTGYRWWIERLRICTRLYDCVRLDHFRAFSAYYAIPDGVSAKNGSWQPGPDMDFFRAVRAELGEVNIIAEDLGELDAGVSDLLALSGFPGMNVWQFTREEMLAMTPEEASRRIFYSDTHDNQTLVGWYESFEDPVPDAKEAADEAIRILYESDAPWVILQLQDLLSLGDEARMNVPGTPSGNWHWQADAAMLTPETAARFRRLAEETGRRKKSR